MVTANFPFRVVSRQGKKKIGEERFSTKKEATRAKKELSLMNEGRPNFKIKLEKGKGFSKKWSEIL